MKRFMCSFLITLFLTSCNQNEPFPFNILPKHLKTELFHIPSDWDIVSIWSSSINEHGDPSRIWITFGRTTGEQIKAAVESQIERGSGTSEVIFREQEQEVYATLLIMQNVQKESLEAAFAQYSVEGSVEYSTVQLPYKEIAYYKYVGDYMPELQHPAKYVWFSNDLALSYTLLPNFSPLSQQNNVVDISLTFEEILEKINILTTPLSKEIIN